MWLSCIQTELAYPGPARKVSTPSERCHLAAAFATHMTPPPVQGTFRCQQFANRSRTELGGARYCQGAAPSWKKKGGGAVPRPLIMGLGGGGALLKSQNRRPSIHFARSRHMHGARCNWRSLNLPDRRVKIHCSAQCAASVCILVIKLLLCLLSN
jgi:hypothetical protein